MTTKRKELLAALTRRGVSIHGDLGTEALEKMLAALDPEKVVAPEEPPAVTAEPLPEPEHMTQFATHLTDFFRAAGYEVSVRNNRIYEFRGALTFAMKLTPDQWAIEIFCSVRNEMRTGVSGMSFSVDGALAKLFDRIDELYATDVTHTLTNIKSIQARITLARTNLEKANSEYSAAQDEVTLARDQARRANEETSLLRARKQDRLRSRCEL